MPTPDFVKPLLGYRVTKTGDPTELPNISDADNRGSVRMAQQAYDALGVPRDKYVQADDDASGAALEAGVRGWLAVELPRLNPNVDWLVDCRVITEFEQYAHLERLRQIVEADQTGVLRVEVGTDYLVTPDGTVSVPGLRGTRLLHASVSCKWTLRSDRAQNVRHEAVMMIRHRRGRLPHITAVTTEPMASRVASLARGTGDVDGVYHVMYDEFVEATRTIGTKQQKQALDELLDQHRLFPLAALAETIAFS